MNEALQWETFPERKMSEVAQNGGAVGDILSRSPLSEHSEGSFELAHDSGAIGVNVRFRLTRRNPR